MAGREDRVAVTLTSPDGEHGVLIGPADKVSQLVRPEAVVERVPRRCIRCSSTEVDLWASWNVVGDWTCAGCASDGLAPTEDAGPLHWDAGCSCGWRGAGEDVGDHPCLLPDPQDPLDCCGHPRERHYGEYGDGVPRCEYCDCSVKSW